MNHARQTRDFHLGRQDTNRAAWCGVCAALCVGEGQFVFAKPPTEQACQ